jgi:MFS family permease
MEFERPMRRPGLIHACILLTSAGLTSLATAVLGPSLPKMQEHFAASPGADYLVPLSLTLPMLVMAILSVFAGLAADRFGRKRLLVAATAVYALCGTAPLWLQTLQSILVSRLLLGVAEACLMTLSTTLIGDYFAGARRAKLMSLHTTVAAVSAFLLNIVGGILGDQGWRTPYWVYAISLPLAFLMAHYLWEPEPDSQRRAPPADGREPPADAQEVSFRLPQLLGTCAITIGVGFAFLTVPVHLAYLFEAIAIQSSAQIGIAFALNSIGAIAGTLVFGWFVAARIRRVASQLALATGVLGLSFLGMSAATTYWGLTLAAAANGVGAGMILPTVVTWNMRELPFSHRGIGVGAFQSSLFFGMFMNPILIVSLSKSLGTRAASMSVLGVALLVASLAALTRGLQGRSLAQIAPRPEAQ